MYTMQQVCDQVADVTGEEPTVVKNKFLTWLSAGWIPVASISGSGRGTRRTYDAFAILKTAIMMRLAQLGMTGDELHHKFELIEGLQKSDWQKALKAGQKLYMIGRPPSDKNGGLLITIFSDTLKDIELFEPAGVGFWVDIGMIYQGLERLDVNGEQ